MQDAGVVLHVAKLLLNSLEAFRGDQVHLVQQQDVAVNHLSPTHLRVQHGLIEVFGIDEGDDRIQSRLLPQFAAQKGHGHWQGISKPRGLHHDVVQLFWT